MGLWGLRSASPLLQGGFTFMTCPETPPVGHGTNQGGLQKTGHDMSTNCLEGPEGGPGQASQPWLCIRMQSLSPPSPPPHQC